MGSLVAHFIKNIPRDAIGYTRSIIDPCDILRRSRISSSRYIANGARFGEGNEAYFE